MKINEKIVKKVINFLNVSDEMAIVKISYLLESLLSEVEKFLIILMILWISGYVYEGIIVLFVMLALRKYMGGNHFNSYWMCFVVSFVICVIPIAIRNYDVSEGFFYFECVITLILVLFLAPVKSKFRPEYTGRLLINLRIKGVLVLCMVILLYFLLGEEVHNIISYTMLEIIIDFIIAGIRNGCSKYERRKEHEKGIS